MMCRFNMNKNYQRSATRERKIKQQFEKEGWFAIRASGSHGVADVVAIRPVKSCVLPSHFEVKFIQIKVSENRREAKQEVQIEETACGEINVEMWKFPVKSSRWHKKTKKKKP